MTGDLADEQEVGQWWCWGPHWVRGYSQDMDAEVGGLGSDLKGLQ